MQYNKQLMFCNFLSGQGQRGLPELHSTYFKGAAGALIVCDSTREETINNLRSWVKTFHGEVGKVPLIFLANKSDLLDDEFDSPEMESVIRDLNTEYMLTSAKSGLNVNKAFNKLGQKIIIKYLKKK